MQTIATQPWPASSVGYEPTGIALTQDGHLLVTLGRANAVAVYRYAGTAAGAGELPRPAADRLLPGRRRDGRQPDRRHQHPRHRRPRSRHSTSTRARAPSPATGHGTHSTTASLTRFTLPSDQDIAQVHRDGVRAERLDRRTTCRRPRGAGRRRPGADAARRPVDHQARLPAGQGEPHLRPGLRRHRRRATATRRWRSSARRSRRTSTRWPTSSVSTTTPTTSAPTRPRATTG